MPPVLTRRVVVVAGLLAPIAAVAATPDPPRVAALDWGLAATVAALGAGPAAVAERAGYADWVREPALPPDAIDLGLRTAPSFEALAAVRPDLILTNALNAPLQPALERIAPLYANTIFAAAGPPVERAIAAARDLGVRLGRTGEAEALVEKADASFAAARQRLGPGMRRPIVPLGFIDGRHARVYGPGSLFSDVMDRVGLVDGWTRPGNSWGFAIIAIEALSVCRDMDVLLVEPVPPASRRAFGLPGLWASLVAASGIRVLHLPPVWAFGDLTAAMRCADLLVTAVAGVPDAAGHA